MDDFPILLTDAQNFPGTIQVTEDYEYTSADGLTTTIGTAVTTFTRVMLGDLVACPKLLFAPGGALVGGSGLSVGKNQFLAVQLAVGRMPGWVLVVGDFDPIEDAFTHTQRYAPPDPGPPVVTHFDGGLAPVATCVALAPGRQTFLLDTPLSTDSYFFGLNSGLTTGDAVEGVAFDVEQIYAGDAGDAKRAAIPPVYRVTLPADFAFFVSLSVVYNGTTIDLSIGPGSTFGSNVLEVAFELGDTTGATSFYAPATALRGYRCIDVQMPNYGDTLAAGTVSYLPAQPTDAATLGAGPLGQVLDDPFRLTGQTFRSDRDDNGLKVTVTFQ